MPIVVGGKRIGGKPPATPLTPFEKALADRLAFVMRATVRAVTPSEIADAIRDLDPDTLARLIQEITVRPATGRIDDALRAIYTSTGEAEIRSILKQDPAGRPVIMDVGVRLPSGIIIPADLAPIDYSQMQIAPFDEQLLQYIDPNAISYAQTRSAQLVADIDSADRLALRRLISDGMGKGLSPMQIADQIQRTIGLHTRWARAVVNMDDKTYQSFIKQGLTPARARELTDPLVKRYRDALIRRRAEMIARTEVMTAQNMARQQSWQVSARSGYVDPSSKKRWLAATSVSRGGPPCDVCASLNGTEVGWNQAFPTGHYQPPAHPYCRCTTTLIPPSRGLTNLPSQNLDYWLAEVAALNAESEAALL